MALPRKVNGKEVRDVRPSDRINHGINKTIKKDKWKARKNKDGLTQSQFMERTSVHENSLGQKFKRKSVRSAVYGASSDEDTRDKVMRGDFTSGKTKRADRIGDRDKYNENLKNIKGFEKKKKTKQGLPMPKKFKKTYK